MERLNVLVSDIDHTLLGDDKALEAFAAWHTTAKNFRLVYNSGRLLESMLQATLETALPVADAYIGGVGTEIHIAPTHQRLADWPVVDNDWCVKRVQALLALRKELELQPDDSQGEHKVSYFASDLDDAYLTELRQHLHEERLLTDIIFSSNRHLDILPCNVNKGAAIGPLLEHWGFEAHQIIVAGDSGNDLAMFRAGYRGIVVSNAQSELKSYHGPNVYHAKASHAAGVLEGLDYWLRADSAQAS